MTAWQRAETTWQCERCGSDRWVGWRAGPEHEGFQRFAQCVPCGHVQDLPQPDGWRDMSTAPRDGTVIEAAWRTNPGADGPPEYDRQRAIRWGAAWTHFGWWAVDDDTECSEPDRWRARPLGGAP